jgi:S1-C subfamily serine protease
MHHADRNAPPVQRRQWALVVALALGGVLSFALIASRTAAVEAAPRPVTPRGNLTTEEQANIQVFETWKSSVVYISTSQRVVDFWTRNVMSVPSGTGSGFVWDEQGHVVTNLHVIRGAADATIKLADGREYPATRVGTSEAHDIAVLRIAVPDRRPAPLKIGTSGDLRVGQKVFAIGNPFGLDWSLTTGIVSALDRSLDGEDGGVIRHLIQTDAAINPGNSGGPLLDSSGRLIGVNTAIYSPSGASAGVGFAVPVDTINRVVPQIIARGHYSPPSFGIEVDDALSRAIEREFGVAGVAVLRAGKGEQTLRGAKLGPRNTVVPGDVILSVEGKEVRSAAELAATLDDYRIGQQLKLQVWREGRRIELRATLIEGDEG